MCSCVTVVLSVAYFCDHHLYAVVLAYHLSKELVAKFDAALRHTFRRWNRCLSFALRLFSVGVLVLAFANGPEIIGRDRHCRTGAALTSILVCFKPGLYSVAMTFAPTS